MQDRPASRKITTDWKFVSGIMVIVHGPDTKLLDSEYDEVVEAYAKHLDHPIRAILISTKGGRPDTMQRKRATDFWTLSSVPQPPTIVMTTQKVVRHTVTALNWFLDTKVRMYDFEDFSGVFSDLDIDDHQVRTSVQIEVKQLHEMLAGHSLSALG